MTVKQLRMVLDRVEDNDEVKIVRASTEYQIADVFDIMDDEKVTVVLTTGTGRMITANRRHLYEW